MLITNLTAYATPAMSRPGIFPMGGTATASADGDLWKAVFTKAPTGSPNFFATNNHTNRIHVTAGMTYHAYALMSCSPNSWVSARIDIEQHSSDDTVLDTSELAITKMAEGGEHALSMNCTIVAGCSYVYMIPRFSSGQSMTLPAWCAIRGLLFCTIDDWQKLQSLGLNRFDGNLCPLS